MIEGLTWDEWCKDYPCKQVNKKPDVYDSESSRRIAAEVIKDKLEEQSALAFEVVQFGDMFYVVYED